MDMLKTPCSDVASLENRATQLKVGIFEVLTICVFFVGDMTLEKEFSSWFIFLNERKSRCVFFLVCRSLIVSV